MSVQQKLRSVVTGLKNVLDNIKAVVTDVKTLIKRIDTVTTKIDAYQVEEIVPKKHSWASLSSPRDSGRFSAEDSFDSIDDNYDGVYEKELDDVLEKDAGDFSGALEKLEASGRRDAEINEWIVLTFDHRPTKPFSNPLTPCSSFESGLSRLSVNLTDDMDISF